MINPSHSIPSKDLTAPTRTFRTFVTGPHNALAHNAALTVARTPGTVYNPLYLSGGPGLGKTHLLHAIAAYLRPRLGGEVIVVDAETFAHEFESHLYRGHMLLFRRRYHRAGALLIDDVAVLARYATAAEELVRTIDALREANRQIVVAGTQRPRLVRGLPDRLRSRLASSPTASISLPDEETRLAILRQRCAQRGLEVSERVLCMLATRIRGSVRDLETALALLVAEITTQGGICTPERAAHVACEANRATRQPCRQAQVEAVLRAICDYYGLARPALLGKSREMPVAQARQVAMYLLREDVGLTATQVGQELGRDHSTVLHGYGRIATACHDGDAVMNMVVESIRKSIVQGHVLTAC